MNISGVELLRTDIVYGPTWYGICIWVVLALVTFTLIGRGDRLPRYWHIFLILLSFIVLNWMVMLTHIETRPTFFNIPCKDQYTIRITDDKVWKEIAPDYHIVSKPYEMEEIYVLERY